jgi:monoamine oxidase
MHDLQTRFNAFTKMHDEFIRDWSHAMSSGDTSSVERMTEDYYVAFFNSGSDRPIFFNKLEAMDGMKQSVSHFLGAEKRFENRVIRLRNRENAVVFYEQLIVKEGEVLARLFTIENWRLVNGKWMVIREIEERIK